MDDDITIPDEALLAARQAFVNAGTSDDDRDPFAEACLAMLKAWPGMRHANGASGGGGQPAKSWSIIILPLPKEGV